MTCCILVLSVGAAEVAVRSAVDQLVIASTVKALRYSCSETGKAARCADLAVIIGDSPVGAEGT